MQQTTKKGRGRPFLSEPTILKNFRIKCSLVDRMKDEPNRTALINQLLKDHYDRLDNQQ